MTTIDTILTIVLITVFIGVTLLTLHKFLRPVREAGKGEVILSRIVLYGAIGLFLAGLLLSIAKWAGWI